MMKVALVVPTKKLRPKEATCIPFGIAYIAGSLKKEIPSCDVIIIDATIGHDVDKTLLAFQPDIIGVTASTSQILGAYQLGDTLLRNSPNVLTVIGGVHASALPYEALQHFDCVVVGEGELTFVQIVKDLINGKRCSGIIQGEQVEDLNSLPLIDYDSLDVLEYIKRGVDLPLLSNPCMDMVTSRGCLYRCVFCHNSQSTTKTRYVNAERIAQEILMLHNKFGIATFYFGDDEFLVNTKRLKEINILFHKYRITDWIKWGCQARSQTCTIETLELAKAAGCKLISIGLESGCERILKYLKCGTTTLADHEKALENCDKVGIIAGGNFIYGVFDQTLEEMQESFNWIKKQKHISFASSGVLIPYPATEVWRKSQELKLLPENVDYSRLILTYFVEDTYNMNQIVPLNVFAKFMINTARMSRIYAKRNHLKSLRKFMADMCKRPVFYWAWMFHPYQMINITFRRN